MRYLKISNSGELDVRLIALMGGTTKSNNKFKIGQFGTGLKYTLSWLFRNNVDFKLFVGEKEVKLTTEKEEIKDEVFEIICIDGQRTSITTGMGKDWKAWMILREIWCNALDEGSEHKSFIDHGQEATMVGEAERTTFYIQISSDIQEILDAWDIYFLPRDLKPVFENETVKLYTPGPHLLMYKNGVLIHENRSVSAVFRYDILNAEINEMREYKHSPSMDISKAVKALDLPGIDYFLGHVTTEDYEGNNMDYNWFSKWGGAWQSFVTSTKLFTSRIRERFHSGGYSYDEKEYVQVPECLYKSLTETFDGLGDIEPTNNRFNFFQMDSPELLEKVEFCINKLKKAKYKMNPDVRIQYGFFDDKSKLSDIDTKKKRIMLSMALIQSEPIEVMQILVESNERLINNLYDGSEVRKHFIKLYTERIMPAKDKEPVKAS